MKIPFNLALVLDSATDTSGGGDWTTATFDITVADMEGVYLASDITAGDLIYLDTSGFEPGTLTKYVIDVVNSASGAAANVSVTWDPSNGVIAPDASYSISSTGFLSRGSTNLGLTTIPSPSIQAQSDKLGIYARNFDILGPLDNGGSAATPRSTKLTIASNGDTAFALPYSPKVAKKAESSLSVNSLTYPFGDGSVWDYAGSTLTWTGPYNLYTTDSVVFNYFS